MIGRDEVFWASGKWLRQAPANRLAPSAARGRRRRGPPRGARHGAVSHRTPPRAGIGAVSLRAAANRAVRGETVINGFRTRVNPATVLAVVALVFAMTGGAYAAKRYLISSTSQLSPKVLKELEAMAGKSGAPGAQGPPGSAGPQGPAGPKGEPGAPGPQGEPGKAGKAGKQGSEGKEGEAGAEGSPWTAGGTLPSGASESGTWSLSATAKADTPVLIPISFTIPLKEPVAPEKIHIFEGTTLPSGCTGTVVNGSVTSLKAAPGSLCVYVRLFDISIAEHLIAFDSETFEPGAGRDGLVLLSSELAEGELAMGTWAVTAS